MAQAVRAAITQCALQPTGKGSGRKCLAKLAFEHPSVNFCFRQLGLSGNVAHFDRQLDIASGLLVLDQLYPFAFASFRQGPDLFGLTDFELVLERSHHGKIAACQFAQLKGRLQVSNLRVIEGLVILQRG